MGKSTKIRDRVSGSNIGPIILHTYENSLNLIFKKVRISWGN